MKFHSLANLKDQRFVILIFPALRQPGHQLPLVIADHQRFVYLALYLVRCEVDVVMRVQRAWVRVNDHRQCVLFRGV